MIEADTRDHRIHTVLTRLENVIDAENNALGTDPNFDLNYSNMVKSRCLYEMTMLFKQVAPDQLSPIHKHHLDTVRVKLDINRVKVQAHMEAVREIAEMLMDAVAASETDGTYSVDQFMGHDAS